MYEPKPLDDRTRLYVKRDTIYPRYWRLCWSRPEDISFVWAEGECSKRLYPTMKSAISAGQIRFGETARKADW